MGPLHRVGRQWAGELLQCTAAMLRGSGQRNSCNALPHYLGLWAVELLLCTATLSGGSGLWNSCNALPHCLGAVGMGAVGSGTPVMHCHTAWGQWAAQLLQCTASLLVGSGHWSSCFAPPHFLEAVGRGTPAMHCRNAQGQWAAQLL